MKVVSVVGRRVLDLGMVMNWTGRMVMLIVMTEVVLDMVGVVVDGRVGQWIAGVNRMTANGA